MNEEQIKFFYNHIYQTIQADEGISVNELYGQIKLKRSMLLILLSALENEGRIKRKGKRYFAFMVK